MATLTMSFGRPSERHTPKEVRVGFDYLAPVLNNFAIRADSWPLGVINSERIFSE